MPESGTDASNAGAGEFRQRSLPVGAGRTLLHEVDTAVTCETDTSGEPDMHRTRRRWLTLCSVALSLVALVPPPASAVHAARARETRIDYAERPVREFLKLHFAGSRKFSPAGLDKKKLFFTRRFRQGLYKFFDRIAESKTSLPMVMDPFTGSQGATTFRVGDAKVRVEKAWVPVSFSDGTNSWTITYLVRNDEERNDDDWRIDDIQDVRGMLLSEVLKR